MIAPGDEPDVWTGSHRLLGATPDEHGTNFAVWSRPASVVYLCLFEHAGNDRGEVERRVRLREHTQGVWHGYVPGVRPGQRYGFRVEGPWDPEGGRVFDADKLLLDPYARAIDGELTVHESLSALTASGQPVRGDTAAYTPRSVVVDPHAFDWGDDRPPLVAWQRTVIYEAHVRGLTQLHPDVPAELRGTYAGLADPAITGYLTDLGVTSVELLPVQHFVPEPEVVRRGLTNYWGYSTIGFFAPHAAYAASGSGGEQIVEFKQMVKSLHDAGLEVILDVVYNHTAEGRRDGPVLCFRGYDDCAYYRHEGSRYADVTGCGNTVDVSEPQVLRLVMDSLRYWATEMHVDGFRFDLASALARNGRSVDMRSAFLTAIGQDPVLRDVKLIAEPWDATQEGYRVGQFPPPWGEWNDRYRDGVRDFWRGRSAGVRELASRLSGSSDLYAGGGRLPFASVNFVTSHDGFTLRDLVSYDHRHNGDNGEDGRDGAHHNLSWNCGVEGETNESAVLALRQRQAANLLATVLLSTGTPMLTAGDERGRTQRGNNNAYCQDNEVSWVSWEEDPVWGHLHELTRTLLRLRAAHPVLRQRSFFTGTSRGSGGRKDLSWLSSTGEEMNEESWHDMSCRTLGMFLAGDEIRPVDNRGLRLHDTSYLLWLHAGSATVDVRLPSGWADRYVELLRTDHLDAASEVHEPGTTLHLAGHSLALLEAVTRPA